MARNETDLSKHCFSDLLGRGKFPVVAPKLSEGGSCRNFVLPSVQSHYFGIATAKGEFNCRRKDAAKTGILLSESLIVTFSFRESTLIGKEAAARGFY